MATKNEAKVEIVKDKVDWVEIKNDCRNTVNKKPTDKEPNDNFKWHLIIAEHSPITEARLKFTIKDLKSWVSVHFARHWLGWQKFVSTQRSDRTGVDRDSAPQDTLVTMNIEANAMALINVGRKRLCYQASPETRTVMEDIKKEVTKVEPQIGKAIVPNCIYRGGCPEFKSCGYWKHFVVWWLDLDHNNKLTDFLDIDTRYKAYNQFFNITKKWKDKEGNTR